MFPIKFLGSRVEWGGHIYEFSVVSPDLLAVVVSNAGGTELGTPIRFKNADGRVAADFPLVDPNSFITNGEHGGEGSITDG